MEIKDIMDLIDRFEKGDSVAMTLKLGDDELDLKKAEAYQPKVEKVEAAPAVAPVVTAPAAPAQPAPAPAAAESNANADTKDNASADDDTINAPLVGTFYHAPSPDDAPFVTVDQTVHQGDTIGLIEAMKMMSEVPAPCDCVIEEVLKGNGELAAYDEPLMRIRKL